MSTATMLYHWEDERIAGDDALTERIERAFADIEAVMEDVDAIAWDSCHKIYVSMSPEQTALLDEYGYAPYLIRPVDVEPGQLLTILRSWYEDSCGLRFISGCAGDALDTEWITFIPQVFVEEV